MELAESVGIKREMTRFLNRYFTSKERTKENLALIYYLLDDYLSFVEDIQVEIANELLDKKFDNVYLEEYNKKVHFEDDLNVLLIEDITEKEKFNLLMKRNADYVQGLQQ